MADNPYEAPKAEVGDKDLSGRFVNYTPAQVKKLYYRSCNINAIALIVAFGIVALATVLLIGDEPVVLKVIFVALVVLYSVTFVGLLKRTSWGRICGIVVCVISLINIPLGTLIGVMGLFAFVKAKELFGPERITHEEVKTAFKGLKGSKLI